jgi:hypothetical protein
MAVMAVFIFPDANLFLQCRDVRELPWNELAQGDGLIEVMIARPVQREVDRLKGDGNTRRARKARKSSSLFRDVIETSEGNLVLREANPRVTLGFPVMPARRDPLPDQFDPNSPDDLLVAEALAFKELSGADVYVLTDDTGPMLTAKRMHLPYIQIPDSWLLPPEPDSRDREIKRLQGRVEDLETQLPRISVSVVDREGNSIEEVELTVCRSDSLSPQRIDELVDLFRRANPVVTDFTMRQSGTSLISAMAKMGHYRSPSKEEIRKYQDDEYPKYLNTLHSFFGDLPERIEAPSRQLQLSLQISNDGTCSAKNVVVELWAAGGILMNETMASEELLRLPKPPEAPGPVFVEDSMFSLHSGAWQPERLLIPNVFREKRDPHDFYWKEKPIVPAEKWEFTCDDFRHLVEPKSLGVVVMVPRSHVATKGALHIRVTAANLPKPFKLVLPVRIDTVQANIEAIISEKFVPKLSRLMRG